MKNNRLIFIIGLILLIVLVWYINYRLIRKIPKSIPINTVYTSHKPVVFDSLMKNDYVYKDLTRDPFNVVNRDTISKEPVMPLFSLAGVVLTHDGSLALMQLRDGNVYTMKKDEKYLGVTIKEITPRQVTIEYRGKKEVLNVLQ